MDWTGGVRRRFAAGKNNATLQRQKAHFAKARAAYQNPRSFQHSSKPDFLLDLSRSRGSSRGQDKAHETRKSGRTQREGSSRSHHVSSHTKPPVSVWNEHNDEYQDPLIGLKARQTERRSPSVIYISSRGQSSSVASVTSHREARQEQPQIRQSSVHTNNMNDKERLLLAKRRKLLARNDWLGLNMLRPISMRFPSSRDKDRIGKRRKVRSSASRKGRPAAPRMVSPPFRRPLSPRNGTMSDALQPDDIRIKIGTDALASQTQPSRHSHTPGRTSVRQLSTEFGLLSEEEMLLGPDDDAFHSELLYGPATGRAQVNVHDDRSLVAMAGSQMMHGPHIIPETAEMGRPHKGSELDEHDQYAPANETARTYPEVAPSSGIARDLYAVPQGHFSRFHPSWHSEEHRVSPPITEYHVQNGADQPVPTIQSGDNDERWRQLFDIEKASSTRHSIAALKSSSMHVTTSESDLHQRKYKKPAMHPYNVTSTALLPEQSVEASDLAQTPAIIEYEILESASAALQSPSASLKQITRLAEQPAVQSRQAQQDAEDEAVWRQFIVGSQDSSDEIILIRHDIREGDNVENVEPVDASSAFTVSGLGTSIKTTVGDTLFVNTDTSSRVSEETSKRKPTLTLAPVKENTSGVNTGPLKTTNLEKDDDIEDAEPPPKHRAQANIHAGTTSILNHKRFKPPVRKPTAPESKPNRFRASRRTRTFTQAGRSVYDLVDSDGASLP